jgi:hypothetical protein
LAIQTNGIDCLTVIGPIDLLAYGTILTGVMFRQKEILMLFFAKKAQ